MTDKTQDPIAVAAETLRGLLVAAAQESQARPTVGRQQAEAEAEIDVLDRILAASDTALQALGKIKKSTIHYEKALGVLEEAREEAAALAELGGNKRLAKACRAVAQVRLQSASPINKTEVRDADQQARVLLKSCHARARARAARAQRHRTEIDEWHQRLTALQGASHALATLARIPVRPCGGEAANQEPMREAVDGGGPASV